MRIPLNDGKATLIFRGKSGCPKTVLINYSGAIINNADVYISPDLQSLQSGTSFNNNTGGNPTFSSGVGLFNQGQGAVATPQPIIIPGVTSDIYARYDAEGGKPEVDLEVESF